MAIEDLAVEFGQHSQRVYAVNQISFSVHKGEWLGLVGESGSGKSVSLLACLGLLPKIGRVVSGRARFGDRDLLRLQERALRELRGRDIGMVFQGLSTALNPYVRVGAQIMEPLLEHRLASKPTAKAHAIRLMEEMGIPDSAQRFNSYPFELSGGMRQRAGIAAALAAEPALLMADEPTTALDTTVQVQVLSVLQEACRRRGMGVILVTHDLAMAAHVCDRIAVLYGGRIMEIAPTATFVSAPAHPYTRALQAALIDPSDPWRPLAPIAGVAAPITSKLTGCPFVTRCPSAMGRCHTEVPIVTLQGPDHLVACHRVQGGILDGD